MKLAYWQHGHGRNGSRVECDEGFGVIDSAETPGGCWAYFSVIVMDGYRRLQAGQRVSFTF